MPENNNLYSLQGLTEAEVLSQRRIFGENILPSPKGVSAWIIFFSQFKSPLIYIILVAAAISLLMGEISDFFIITVVIVIDVALGFAQEYKAHQTYKALKGLLKTTAKVIRDGIRREVDVREVVPGDLAILNAGERIPGDGELIYSTKFSVDEAVLTGESEPVSKSSQPDSNQVYMGTTVVTGRGFLKVAGTGLNTELGKIADAQKKVPQIKTPLQIKLQRLSRNLTFIVVGITMIVLTVGLFTGRPLLEMLRISIVLAIAAVPEALPIAVTVIQVIGMRKILKRNGLVHKLIAVETLGSVTVICTDKTGTLTEGHMQVVRSDFANPKRALETLALCNNLEGPVDAALWEYAKSEQSYDPQELAGKSERLAEVLFTSDTKFMVTENLLDGERILYMKGAPEIVLDMCRMDSDLRVHTLKKIDEWAGDGLRLLGFAYKMEGSAEDTHDFIWNGIVGMEDPLREGVLNSIEVAQRAGVKVKMITGDYRVTAEHIAKNIGLLGGNSRIVEGQELSSMSDSQLKDIIDDIAVFARIRPYDKLRIVRTLQEKGEITAMIGDGVNDAPALQQANIGVVVGSATDVAKETADLILLDNNFRTVVAAIEEGRVIFDNIRKVVSYVLSNSFAEIIVIFAAMMLGWPTPLLVAQILWIHLICDGPADIMLGFEPKEEGIMEEKPKSTEEQILTSLSLSLIAIISIVSAIAALLIFGAMLNDGGGVALGRSYVFAIFAVNSMVYIFAYRSMRKNIFKGSGLLSNKPLLFSAVAGLAMAIAAFQIIPLREVLGLAPLNTAGYGLVFAVAFLLLVFVEIGKYLNNHVKT
ncbi:MAG: cation-translocating P-type ATPase [Clostridiaceae bacterium]